MTAIMMGREKTASLKDMGGCHCKHAWGHCAYGGSGSYQGIHLAAIDSLLEALQKSSSYEM